MSCHCLSVERTSGAPWLLDQRSPRCQSGVVLWPVVSMRWRWCRVFAGRRIWQMLLQINRAWEKTPCPVVVAQTSAKTLRNGVDDAFTPKPSCRRGSGVCRKPRKVEVVKRERGNVGSRISSHKTCLKGVRGELPIGLVARKISEGSLDFRLECRTHAVRICEAALRHPWIHFPHCPVDGYLRWSCSKCGKKLQSVNGCFPIYPAHRQIVFELSFCRPE